MMVKKTSMVAIGKAAGVSQATVSNVINDCWREKGITQATRDRVMRIAREMNYRPNRLVHSVFSGRTHSVAVILPTLGISYFSKVASGIEAEAKRHGYHTLISQVERGIEEEADEIEDLLERRVDGLILVPRYAEKNKANYRRLIGEGVPLVFYDQYYPEAPCPAVVTDDEEGTRTAVEHLIGLGHRRIGYIGKGQDIHPHLRDRYNGYCRAMKAHRLSVLQPIDAEGMDQEIVQLLNSPDRPTALAAQTDHAALRAMLVAESLGLRIPEDLAVIGYGDYLENVELLRIPVSSVRIDLHAMGRLAMEIFLREVEKMSKRHEVKRVPTSLAIRASSGTKIRKD